MKFFLFLIFCSYSWSFSFQFDPCCWFDCFPFLGVGVPTHKVLLLGSIIFIDMNIFLFLMLMFLFMKFFFLGSILVADLIVFSSWYDPCYWFNHLLFPNVGVLFYEALLLCLIFVANMIVFLFLILVFLLMMFFSRFDLCSKTAPQNSYFVCYGSKGCNLIATCLHIHIFSLACCLASC
jgi:hypothetical protein